MSAANVACSLLLAVPSAPWRPKTGSEAVTDSEHTQEAAFGLQNVNFLLPLPPCPACTPCTCPSRG
jgi:hypothetical protein